MNSEYMSSCNYFANELVSKFDIDSSEMILIIEKGLSYFDIDLCFVPNRVMWARLC